MGGGAMPWSQQQTGAGGGANLSPSTNKWLKRGRVVPLFHPSPTARHSPVPVGSPLPNIFNLRLAGFVNKEPKYRRR